jgi:hypothetical protein
METKKKVNLYEYHKLFDEDVLISYKGPFESNILTIIGDYIKMIIKKNPKVSKKIFAIFMELAQNISYYSAEKNRFDPKHRGIGTLVITEVSDFYTFAVGNIVSNHDIVPVIEKCEIINSLDREALRQYKRDQRNLPSGEFGNAHIGLIQVALTSENPLDIEVTPISATHSFFSIKVKIDKLKVE